MDWDDGYLETFKENLIPTEIRGKEDQVKATQFQITLPYFISIPDGSYEVKIRDLVYQLYIKREVTQEIFSLIEFEQEPSVEEILQWHCEMPFDRRGHFVRSIVIIEFNGFVNDFEVSPKSHFFFDRRIKIKELAIGVLNRFIAVYRAHTMDFHLEDLCYSDFPDFTIDYIMNNGEIIDGGTTRGDTGMGGIHLCNHIEYRANPRINEIRDALLNELPIDNSVQYLLNAKAALLQEDYRRATLEGVIALEFVLYETINRRMRNKNIQKKPLKEFIKKVGLTGSLDVTLPLILTEGESIEKEIISACKGAITIRNDIVHNGLNNISQAETEIRISNIEKMIDFLKKIP